MVKHNCKEMRWKLRKTTGFGSLELNKIFDNESVVISLLERRDKRLLVISAFTDKLHDYSSISSFIEIASKWSMLYLPYFMNENI